MNILFLKDWLGLKPLSAGDWPYLFGETIQNFTWPFPTRPGGYPPLDFYFQATAKILNHFGFSWPLIERVVWFWPTFILTLFSAWYLSKNLFPKQKLVQVLAPMIYFFNTYLLMVVAGGQMGVAMAYALAPLVFSLINQLTGSRVNELKKSVLVGLVLAIQIMFDPRMALLTMGGAFFYLLLVHQKKRAWCLRTFFLAVFIGFIPHLVWFLPIVWTGGSALPVGYGGVGWVEFLSFADFSQTFSLLHPNWPENIFGQVYFMRPEFIFLPILAFSSILFVDRLTGSRVKEAKSILFFSFLALAGSFLAKGAKPPLGGVYLWLFEFLPGMNLFRDPTKFYLLTALAYSTLIPFSLSKIYTKLKKRRFLGKIFLFLFFGYGCFLMRPFLLGEARGTFRAKPVPPDYLELKDFLYQQDGFFRTFWLPKTQRFGFSSSVHPALEGEGLPSQEELLAWQVRYVIIPFDSEKEIFLKDRQYDHPQRLAWEERLGQISWLTKVDLGGKVTVYEVSRKINH